MKKIFCAIASIFFMSCGLDVIIYVNEPKITNNNPRYDSGDYLTWYFDFETEESDQPETFIGTEVYYKIYNNYSSLDSQRNSILSVNTTSNASSAVTQMIDNYKYQSLGARNVKTGNASDNVIFIHSGAEKSVQFRLKTYKGMESYEGEKRYSYRACILGGNYGQDGAFVPYRNGNEKSFDFFDDDEDNKNGSRDVEPVEGEADYYYSSSPSESDTYYVQLFAVAVAFDEVNLSNSYSLVLDLGSVPIRKGQ